MAECAYCGAIFRAKRTTGRYCSARCRKAAFLTRQEGASDAGTLSGYNHTSLSVPAVPDRDGGGGFDLGTLPGDTIPGRRWRIVVEGDTYVLQCDALVPGGWMDVATEPTMLAVRRFGLWLGVTIAPVDVATEQPELIAA